MRTNMDEPAGQEKPELIPTLGKKTPIPRDWSYPIGAEILSRTFSGVPQFKQLSIGFNWSLPKKGVATLPLFGIEYADPRKTALERNWMITLYAVPASRKAFVRDLFIAEVLPRARAWMADKRPQTWYAGWKFFNVRANQQTFDLEFEESRWG